MDGTRWLPFESSSHPAAIRFQVFQNRLLRIRDRSRETNGGDRCYIVIDLWTRKVIDNLTEYVPRADTPRRAVERE
jgi:hypothetical protein